MSVNLNEPSPFLKWVGGKRKLLSKYSSIFPSEYNRYIEPFLGGGSVFFGLTKTSKNCILSDINHELINTYQCVKDSYESVYKILCYHSNNYSEEYYYKIRDLITEDPIESAARFIFLNKSCHGGLYRVNKSGQFNVSWGKYKEPALPTFGALKRASEKLQNSLLINADFRKVLSEANSGDFVFCDPPYIQIIQKNEIATNQLSLDLGIVSSETKNKMFVQYTSDGFDIEKHIELRNVALKLSKEGVLIAIANADCEYTRELYKDFTIYSLETTHSINRDVSGRQAPVREILAINWR